MRIVIVGCGKMGGTLADRLVAEKHDVTIIDRDPQVIDNCLDKLDALAVRGSGVSAEALKEAEIQRADIVIAATVSDETNMLCCLTAKNMGAKYTIARIRDPEYLKSVPFLTKELSINYVVNPERATAREISRMLRLPFATSVETFARGRVEMVEFRLTGTEPFVGVSLAEFNQRYPKFPRVLFCAVRRDQKPYIPKGDFVLREGDTVFVASASATITSFFKAIGRDTRGAHDVMMIGGSRIAYYLSVLLHESGVNTTLIEHNEKKARWLSEELPNTNIIQGDGTDQQFLLSEGLNNCDAFIALTDRDEENLMTGLFALQNGKIKVIAKNNRENYSAFMRAMGMDGIVSPLEVACNIILRTVRARANIGGTAVERMYRLMDGQAEALEFIARSGAPYIGVPLKNLNPSALIAVIVRGNQVRVPFGDDIIEEEDHVVIITRDTGIMDLNDIMGDAK